jgi:hypothetical protein
MSKQRYLMFDHESPPHTKTTVQIDTPAGKIKLAAKLIIEKRQP